MEKRYTRPIADFRRYRPGDEKKFLVCGCDIDPNTCGYFLPDDKGEDKCNHPQFNGDREYLCGVSARHNKYGSKDEVESLKNN